MSKNLKKYLGKTPDSPSFFDSCKLVLMEIGRQIIGETRGYGFPPNYVKENDWYANYLVKTKLLKKGPVEGSYILTKKGRGTFEQLKSEETKKLK